MFERVMYWMFPQLLLEGTPYHQGWQDQEQTRDIRFWRILFPIIAVACLAKGYFSLPPDHGSIDWLQRHWTLAAVCVGTAAAYLLPSVYRARFYRLPVAVAMLTLCLLLAKTMVGYGKDQYLLMFIVIILASWCLRTSVFLSTCFAALAIYMQWEIMRQAGVPQAVAVSFSVGVLVFVGTARADYAGSIRYYAANESMAATQQQSTEMSIEFSDRIRAFLPKQISDRVTQQIGDNHLTVQQAVDAVLLPAERQIACLFTDIRGFTRGTKENTTFVSDGVIPNVVRCSRVIENHFGIPRKVGDLLFAYFDDDSAEANLVRCLSAACEIVEANARFNQTNEFKLQIRRYLLVATGTALVGNLGELDSAIDISAQGGPVDLLGQMDQLTKSRQFREHVNETDVVLCAHTAALLHRVAPDCRLQRFDLGQLGAATDDFKGIDSLWVFATNDHNRHALAACLEATAPSPNAQSAVETATRDDTQGYALAERHSSPRMHFG
jgi:class 3 adenylate cyclase